MLLIIKKKLKLFLTFFMLFSLKSIYTFKVTPLQDLLKIFPQITYQKVTDELPFELSPSTIVPSLPYKGTFKELFILTIPNGIVKGLHGNVMVELAVKNNHIKNTLIQELIWSDDPAIGQVPADIQNINTENILSIPGKLAVIEQVGADTYGHWIQEILGRLSILEINNVDYDWIYISHVDKSFIKKILNLWGINHSKIICPLNDDFTIAAETLIVPSLVIRTDQGHKQFGNYLHPKTMAYTREKLLKKALQQKIDLANFSKKVFISRSDNINLRRILNEDEVFKIFETKGFKKYSLSEFSLEEQIMLFHNAEIIVGEHGSGLSNIMFCKPNTHIIELFHHFAPMDFWYSSSLWNLKYTPVNTLNIDLNFFSNYWKIDQSKMIFVFNACPIIPLEQISELVKTL